MTRNQLRRNRKVWARCGAYGWTRAIVVKVARKFVHLRREDYNGNMKRLPSALEPRNPNEKDKPAVLDAEKSYDAEIAAGIVAKEPADGAA